MSVDSSQTEALDQGKGMPNMMGPTVLRTLEKGTERGIPFPGIRFGLTTDICRLTSCLFFTIFLFFPDVSSSQSIYISVDMEGVAGVVTGDQLSPGGFEYERFRGFMTMEALAAVKAAKDAGATRVLVSDSHGNGENLLIDQFPPDVRVIRSWPRKLGMMAGIDSSFDAAVFIGYHSSTNNASGVRAHTFSSARLTKVALNGKEVPEGVWNAAVAGEFGVPVVMVSGDEAVLKEIQDAVGPIETAEVKRSLGFHSANTVTPERSRELIGQAVRRALANWKRFSPYKLKGPVILDISFKHYMVSEVLAYLSGVQRTDAHSIRWSGMDMLEVSDFMVFLTNYRLELEP